MNFELIKYLSILSMIIDHIGLIYYPDINEFRYIGRFAFIGFSFILIHNYKHNTSNKFNFKLRLLLWGIISIIPFIYAFNSLILNIMFTFLFSFILIDKIDKQKYYWFLLLPLAYFVDYGVFGVIFLLGLYYLNKENVYEIILLFILAFLVNYYDYTFGLFSLLSLLFILYFKIKININRIPGIYFYIFYPLHLIILKLGKAFV